MFGKIKFQDEITSEYAEGIYDKRKFVLMAGDEGVTIDGVFTDDEKRFIYTQWEMRL
ncbi:hypothetical protein D3C74_465250 [compost metagenome]